MYKYIYIYIKIHVFVSIYICIYLCIETLVCCYACSSGHHFTLVFLQVFKIAGKRHFTY